MKAVKLIFLTLFTIFEIMPIYAMDSTKVDISHSQNEYAAIIPNPIELENKSNIVLVNALTLGDVEMLKEALSNGANINLKMTFNVSPLHLATGKGHLDIVKHLITNGAYVDEKDDADATPLDYAFRAEQFDIIKYLITTCNPANSRNSTPLTIAAELGWLEIAQRLIESGAAVNAQDINGCTALERAASQGYLEIVKLLIANGANVCTKNCTSIPLGSASYKGHLEVVKYLLKSGADINAQNTNENSPLLSALIANKLEVVQFLLSKGAILNAKDFGYAISEEYVLAIIEQCHFITSNPHAAESHKRLVTTLCSFKSQNFPKDLCKKILAYLTEDLLSEKHAEMIYTYNADIKKDIKVIIPYCTLSFFNRMYLNISDSEKQAFLDNLIPLIVEYRFNEVKKLLKGQFSFNPRITSIINIGSIEQHRAAITKHVTNGILGIDEEPDPNPEA